MNVYDEVNNLARAIKECREFTEYKEAKEKVNSVEGLKKQIDEFEKIRYEEQVFSYPFTMPCCSNGICTSYTCGLCG